jgi:CRP/FNR family transcriptional regulator, cyclic AMP receptor protein
MSKRGFEVFGQINTSRNELPAATSGLGTLREIGAATILLDHLQDGEWLGAAEPLEGEQESPTTRQILERVTSNPALARELILRLSATLHDVEHKISEDKLAEAREASSLEAVEFATSQAKLSIAAGSEALLRLMGATPIEDAKLPFLVGRVPDEGEARPPRRPDLLIDDRVPFRLSRQHFMIARHDDRLLVSDLGSALGTIVNGEAIGHPFLKRSIALRRGENRILAGGRDSPFEFVVSVS